MDDTMMLILRLQLLEQRWEDEPKANDYVEVLRREFQKRLTTEANRLDK